MPEPEPVMVYTYMPPRYKLYSEPFQYWGGGLWVGSEALAVRFADYLRQVGATRVWVKFAPNGWEVKADMPRWEYQRHWLDMWLLSGEH